MLCWLSNPHVMSEGEIIVLKLFMAGQLDLNYNHGLNQQTENLDLNNQF